MASCAGIGLLCGGRAAARRRAARVLPGLERVRPGVRTRLRRPHRPHHSTQLCPQLRALLHDERPVPGDVPCHIHRAACGRPHALRTGDSEGHVDWSQWGDRNSRRVCGPPGRSAQVPRSALTCAEPI